MPYCDVVFLIKQKRYALSCKLNMRILLWFSV